MDFKILIRSNKVSEFIKYSSIKYIALLIGFIKGIVNARMLDPQDYGLLGNLLLILSYLNYSNLGILYSMNREYVIYISKKDENRANKVIYTSFTSLLLISLILVIVGIYIKNIYDNEFGNYLFIVFIIASIDHFKLFFINYFRLIEKIEKINFIEVVNNVFSFILICITISNLKIYSVLLATFISDLIIFIYGYKNSNKIKLTININILLDLIKLGIPLLLYNLGFYLISTVDRMMIINYLSYENLGYYTFANQIVGGTLVFITSITFLLYPKIMTNLNTESVAKNRILENMKLYTKYIELFCIILMIIGCIAIEPFVRIMASEYSLGIPVYRILIIGTVANQLSYFANMFIVSNKKQIHLIYTQIIVIFLSIFLNKVFISINNSIISISLATLITNMIYSIIQYIIYLRLTGIKNIFIKNIVNVYLKFIIYTIFITVNNLINISYCNYIISIIIITILIYYKDFKVIFSNIYKEYIYKL